MKVPRVILEAEDYRKEVIEDLEIDTDEDYNFEEDDDFEEDEQEVISGSAVSLALPETHDDVRSRTNYALMQLYEQKGYDVFKKVCGEMRSNKGLSSSDFGFFKGEACEAFLTATIREFIKKFDLPWKVYTSLIVKHRDESLEGGVTEIDVTLVSQEMITVFEAKSYSGKKTLTGKCSINHSTGKKDLYGQNSLHCESLLKLIRDYNINGNAGMKSALFWYADGTLTDKREDAYKAIMPAITEDNLLAYLTALTNLTDKYWNQSIFQRFDEISKMHTVEEHRKFVGY